MKSIFYQLVIVLFCFLEFSAHAQTIFWTEGGGIIKSKNLPTGSEKLLFEDNRFYYQIDEIFLDKKNERIFFHIPDDKTSAEKLMTIDYNGDNLRLIGEYANTSTDGIFYDSELNLIIYRENFSHQSLLKTVDEEGNVKGIFSCEDCTSYSSQYNSLEKKIYFVDSDSLWRIDVAGVEKEFILFLPDFIPDFTSNITINPYAKELYWTTTNIFPPIVSYFKKVGFFDSKIDTLFISSMAFDTTGSFFEPVFDPLNSQLYTILQNFVFSVEGTPSTKLVSTLKQSNLDGTNLRILDETISSSEDLPEINTWDIDPDYGRIPDLIVKHYHQIEDHQNFDTLTLLNMAYTNSNDNPNFKVCTDGSNASIFKIEHVFNSSIKEGDFIFRIQEDPNNENSELYGKFTTLSPFSNDGIYVNYVHPKYIASKINGTPIHLELVDLTTNNIILVIPLKQFFPPVLMIHGLNSNNLIFDELRMFLDYPKDFIVQPNYEDSNDDSFKVNSELLQTNITEVFSKLLSETYSVGKVDVVGHSMGGILTRLYLQAEYYNDDINKLITLNTPHSGSEIANIIYIVNEACEVLFNQLPFVRDFECFGDAIENLRTNSAAILEDLNGKNINLNKEPSHAITTTIDNPEVFNLIEIILGLVVFGSDAHDYIVSKTSQEGGLSSDNISRYESPHWESYNNSLVKKQIKNLLSSSSDSDLFAQNGFRPANLSSNSSGSSPLAKLNKVPINVSSFFENKVINYGDNVDINVLTNSNSDTTIIIYNGIALLAPRDNIEKFDGGDLSITRKIEPSRLGVIPITAYSYNRAKKTWGQDTLSIEVTTDEKPISFNQGIGVLIKGQKTRLPISATFQNFTTNVSGAKGIKYEFKNGLAEYIGNGYVMPLKAGLDTLTIVFNGKKSQEFRVRINDDLTTSIVDKPINPNFKDNGFDIVLSPNPVNDMLRIKHNLPKRSDFLLKVTDSRGRIVIKRENVEMMPNRAIPLPVRNLPKGFYFLTIYSDSIVKTKKFIKN